LFTEVGQLGFKRGFHVPLGLDDGVSGHFNMDYSNMVFQKIEAKFIDI
jgi:hypothetical protein